MSDFSKGFFKCLGAMAATGVVIITAPVVLPIVGGAIAGGSAALGGAIATLGGKGIGGAIATGGAALGSSTAALGTSIAAAGISKITSA